MSHHGNKVGVAVAAKAFAACHLDLGERKFFEPFQYDEVDVGEKPLA
jgi:hypothetical protein